MDEVKRSKLFASILQEVIEDMNRSQPTEPRKKSIAPCGCESHCGDKSAHDENTVLEGTIVDYGD